MPPLLRSQMDHEEDIRLAKNFTLNELLKSATADRMGIENWPKDEISNFIKIDYFYSF